MRGGVICDMVFGFLAGLFGGTAISAALTPIESRTSRAWNNLDPTQLLAASSYADGYRLGYITKDAYYQYQRELGFSRNQAKLFYNTAKVFLSKEDIAIRRIAKSFESVMNHYTATPDVTYNQNTLNPIKEEFCRLGYRIGYDKDESEKLFEALRPVPTFSILLEWLAKEVFEPDIRRRFLLDTDYPAIWDSLMQSIGVPEFERRAYWASHWIHPAPGQIGDMYTRFRSDRTNRSAEDAAGAGVTISDLDMSKADFTESLKLHELAPYWRDRIIANSFRPLPLTLLQTAYAFGIKDDAWMKGRLEDYGYSSGNAQFVLDVWARKFPKTSKAPLNTNIIKRYEIGQISRSEANNLFATEGVSAEVTSFILDSIDGKITLRNKGVQIANIRRYYRSVSMTETELVTYIRGLGIGEVEANRIKEHVIDAESIDTKRIRLRDIVRGYNEGNIERAAARGLLDSIRIDDDDLDTILNIYQPEASNGE